MKLSIGQIYKRLELHDAFGGTRQSGISPSSKEKQILIFSNDNGEAHGYEDGWLKGNQYFSYTGAGQKGDQDIESSRHNGRLLHHQERGDTVRLFTGTKRKGYYTYEANLTVVDYEFFQTHDTEGKNRRAVKFIFERDSSGPASSSNTTTHKQVRATYRKPDTTSRKGLVTSRVGQGYYRQALLNRFNFCCAVTGANKEDLLVASHIVPWSESNDQERLDIDNGILLSPTYDALFDRHLISFSEDGRILVSSKLANELLSQLGVTGEEQIVLHDGMKQYLQRHRDDLQ